MRRWSRTASPCDVSRLPVAEAEALRQSARRRLGEDSFGPLRAVGLRVVFEWLSGEPRQRTQHLLRFERYLVIVDGSGA